MALNPRRKLLQSPVPEGDLPPGDEVGLRIDHTLIRNDRFDADAHPFPQPSTPATPNRPSGTERGGPRHRRRAQWRPGIEPRERDAGLTGPLPRAPLAWRTLGLAHPRPGRRPGPELPHIHRHTLVDFDVLPFTFADPADCDRLEIGDPMRIGGWSTPRRQGRTSRRQCAAGTRSVLCPGGRPGRWRRAAHGRPQLAAGAARG